MRCKHCGDMMNCIKMKKIVGGTIYYYTCNDCEYKEEDIIYE